MQVEIAEYTINNQMELILEDIYRRKPDMVGISCYIWNIAYALDLVRDIHKGAARYGYLAGRPGGFL